MKKSTSNFRDTGIYIIVSRHMVEEDSLTYAIDLLENELALLIEAKMKDALRATKLEKETP